MTTQTSNKLGTTRTTALGEITIVGHTWVILRRLYTPGPGRPLPNTWGIGTAPELCTLTWLTEDLGTDEKGTVSNPGTFGDGQAVLAAAPAAILHNRPHIRPELVWTQRETKDGTAYVAPLLTITHANGNIVEVQAFHHPAFREALGRSNGMSAFSGSRPHRELLLLVTDMDAVDLGALFEQLRTAPQLLG